MAGIRVRLAINLKTAHRTLYHISRVLKVPSKFDVMNENKPLFALQYCFVLCHEDLVQLNCDAAGCVWS